MRRDATSAGGGWRVTSSVRRREVWHVQHGTCGAVSECSAPGGVDAVTGIVSHAAPECNDTGRRALRDPRQTVGPDPERD